MFARCRRRKRTFLRVGVGQLVNYSRVARVMGLPAESNEDKDAQENEHVAYCLELVGGGIIVSSVSVS